MQEQKNKAGIKQSCALVYPHQLFEVPPWQGKVGTVLLVEDPLYFIQYAFHSHKLVLHRASMQRYADVMRAQGYNVQYIEHFSLKNSSDIADYLEQWKEVHMVDVVDDYLERALVKALVGKDRVSYETPLFLTTTAELRSMLGTKQRHRMHDFYVAQRKRLQILLENDGTPTGAKWSFDEDNRKKLPKGVVPPPVEMPEHDRFVVEACEYVRTYFPKAPGNPDQFQYETSHQGARAALHQFVEKRYAQFGPYEDALHTQERTVFHSVLTPYLNTGLLSVREALAAVLAADVPLQSKEGFVRQLIGWREFMRAMYVVHGRRMRTQSSAQVKAKPLPAYFWTAHTDNLPLRTALQSVLDTAYNHHIERLMVLGNWCALQGYDPHEVYEWFMTMYIDAYDWVMVPNVYDMALGVSTVFSTKPYVSSSNYLLKMSNFSKGEWCAAWDAQYWLYMRAHKEQLLQNARMPFLKKQLESKTEADWVRYEESARKDI
jgi:deoxyribodipyrimidine photolyase-related protein